MLYSINTAREGWKRVYEQKRARLQGVMRRLNADEELLGWPKASPEPGEEERERRLKEGVEREHSWNRGIMGRNGGG